MRLAGYNGKLAREASWLPPAGKPAPRVRMTGGLAPQPQPEQHAIETLTQRPAARRAITSLMRAAGKDAEAI